LNSSDTPLVLAVDDDRVSLMAIEAKIKKLGYNVITADGGSKAISVIEEHKNKIDVIILDRMMPEVDGMGIVSWLKSQNQLSKIPIVMQTGLDKPEQVREGLDVGVYYYLTKPTPDDILSAVVKSAIKESVRIKTLGAELKRHRGSFSLIQKMSITLKTIEQAEDVSCFLANCYQNPEVVLQGIAELIINAIEHGNLGVTYEEKSELISSNTWLQELNKRQELPENANKVVIVEFEKNDDVYKLVISDQGKGFVWNKHLNSTPATALDSYGRGISRANMIFSRIEYNNEGNSVTAIIDNGQASKLNW